MNNLKTILRKIIYISLGTVDSVFGRKNKIVVFAYHNITNHPWVFNVKLSKFEEQMTYLSTVGEFISLKDLELFFDGKNKLPERSFLITFDDGYRGVKSCIEIAKKYGIKPVVFALGKETSVDRGELKTNSGLLSTSDIRELVEKGWEIGSHGLTHTKLTKISSEQVTKEIKGSKTFLESKTKKQITSFAYPHGKYNSDVVSAVNSEGYRLGFSMDDGIITKDTNRFAIPRVGVMGNHSKTEFKYLAAPSVVGFRNIVKKTFLSKYI